ncbi:MAG: MarR family transcriptional regulator [Rhodospirillales bacterium]|nr:MarR family transcriptional regulator [Rhodospirillales bacterium]MBO6788748.1 MarR family transcriptional regulator [Rhodospirillales bacterium]
MTLLIERLHRRFLDVLRIELKSIGVRDINGVQALMLTNIGDGEIIIRDLIERGYYQGSNVSYNIKKLTDYGYLDQERALHDKRSITVKLTEKGKKVVEGIRAMEEKNGVRFETTIGNGESVADAANMLRKLERTWDEFIRYGD